jgi:hypothetical protein
MRTLYLDCFSGISGDMTMAALISAGADPAHIEQQLKKLHLDDWQLNIRSVVKKGVTALKVDVKFNEDHHVHRTYQDIMKLLAESDLDETVKHWSMRIFTIIGEAEAKIHNIPIESVHFHEVGAVDSIVDIVGTAAALDILQVERVLSSPVPVGQGSVRCAHGIYPVPAPATLEILKGVPIRQTGIPHELTTPTGAAIVKGLGQGFQPFPSLVVEQIGYGAGTRDLPDRPNILRAVVGLQSIRAEQPRIPLSGELDVCEPARHNHHIQAQPGQHVHDGGPL